MAIPAPGPGLPRRGNAFSRALGRLILGAFGWRITGALPDVPRCVLIAAPHTSNWDFVFGIAAMLALGVDVRWLGKHTIFRPPFRSLLRFLGGTPINRDLPVDVVEQAIASFAQAGRLFLAIAPEGTRGRVEQWKSGFHRIARGAGVPIFWVALDHGAKAIALGGLFQPTPDFEADAAALKARFSSSMARNPGAFWDQGGP
jgi:1-acyl-sn-glycerol-3-phosphate acyltransferase